MSRHVSLSYSRPENAIAFFSLSFFCVAAECKWLGEVGTWMTHYLHAAFGHAAWLIPAWLGNAAWRAFVGSRWSIKYGIESAFGLLVACTSFGLCETQGGWVGVQSACALRTTIGIGAYVIVAGVWIVGCLRALGPGRVQLLIEHIFEFAHRAFDQVRPVLRLPERSLQGVVAGRPLSPPLPAPVPLRVSLETISDDPERQRGALICASTSVPEHISLAPTKRPGMSSHWTLPSNSLIRAPRPHVIDHSYISAVARDLGKRLQSYGINATVEEALVQGALLYKFEITPGASQDLKSIMALQVNFEAAYKGFRFVPLPGTGKLGIEIAAPKEQRGEISIRQVLDSRAWAESDAALPIVLGVTTSGEPVVIDLAESPHLLVAGTTGSGKSVGVNVMLASLLLRNSPAELQLLLFDPKRVELARYKGLPHLIAPPVTEIAEMVKMLQWACREMDDRYRTFEAAEVTDIVSFNESSKEKMPLLVLVIDEWADLKSVAGKAVEDHLIRLAQKARACGIHVIVATQRPSVDIITGAIKANFPSRVAYKVAQPEDSRTIIGGQGANMLLGKGDSLCRIPELSTDLVRVHGAFIHQDDSKAICAFWRSQTALLGTTLASPMPLAALPVEQAAEAVIVEPLVKPATSTEASVPSTPVVQQKSRDDELYERAIVIAKEKTVISQRDIETGLNCNIQTARRVFEKLKQSGLIKPGGPNNKHVYAEPN